MISCRCGVVQSQRQRNHGCLPRPQPLFEQRVPRLRELKHRRCWIGKPRTYAFELGGKTSPSLQTIELGQNRRALCDGMGLHPNLPRHGQKNAPGLGLLFFDQPHQLIVLLDGLERLQVNRLPAGGGAMHHPGNTPLMLRLHRDHKTLPADSDQVLLRAASFRETPQSTAQAFFDHSLLAFHLPADSPQIGGRIIAQRAVGIEARPQRTCQVRQLCPCGQLAQCFQPSELCGHIFRRALDQSLPGGDVIHQEQQVADLFRLQQALPGCAPYRSAWSDQTIRPAKERCLVPAASASRSPGRAVGRSTRCPVRASSRAAMREPQKSGRNSPPAPAAAPIRALRNCIPPPPTELALRDSQNHARAITRQIVCPRPRRIKKWNSPLPAFAAYGAPRPCARWYVKFIFAPKHSFTRFLSAPAKASGAKSAPCPGSTTFPWMKP